MTTSRQALTTPPSTSADSARSGRASPSNNGLAWRYPPADSAYHDALLFWSFKTGRFSLIPFLRAGADEEIRLLEDRSDVYSEVWAPGSTLCLGSYDDSGGTSTELKTFSDSIGGGENGASSIVGAARFQLAFRETLKDQTIAPAAVQLAASPDSGSSGEPSLSVTVNPKKSPADAVDAAEVVTITNTDSDYSEGWMSLRADVGGSPKSPTAARFHQFDITVTPTATWHASEIQGIQMRYTVAGSY